MKTIKVYEDENGVIHRTREACEISNLIHELQTDNEALLEEIIDRGKKAKRLIDLLGKNSTLQL